MLIIFGGLPGSGKTTISRALAKELGAVHLRIDTIEQNIRASDMLSSEVGPAGYMVGYGIAEDNLTLGKIVVADSVNPLKVTRDAWLSVAARSGVPAVEIEIVCSDRNEHRWRVETRASDVPGLVKPLWEEVTAHYYESWEQSPIVIDTAKQGVDEAVAALLSQLETVRYREAREV
ncbi:AAA family ATPase [Rhizobium sp. BK377]|uniref:AAA family ATPase n=1 Tax=Rhizobium sp. BK377 TaxID=2587058 RepID=UPI001611B2A3|nr:AAA family ATPase [Rhizobium sp. BK377]MBB3461642.1 putative kinase [Rhizobium sp. BK377]